MTKCALIILNYNTAIDAVRLANSCNRLISDEFTIILIDNNSNDVAVLRDYHEECSNSSGYVSVNLLETGENGGYAKGNNVGLKYARQIGCEIAFIINPDIELIDSSVFDRLCDLMEKYGKLAMLGPKILNPNGWLQKPSLRENWWIAFNFAYPISGLILKVYRSIEFWLFGMVKCYTVHGCFICLRLSAWEEVGYFDEGTFLYAEESIMGEKFRRANWDVGYTERACVLHRHIYSPSFVVDSHNIASRRYYFKQWLKFSDFLIWLYEMSDRYQQKVYNFIQPVTKLLRGIR